MPIGVPKIPFQFEEEFEFEEEEEGEKKAHWVDLFELISQLRILFLGEEIEIETSNHISGLMIYLSIEDPNPDLYFLINSPGGWIGPGMGIFNVMTTVPSDVQTICVGMAASMASLLLVGGEVKKRMAYPHARIMIHQPAADFLDEDQTLEFVLDGQELLELREMLVTIYTQRTGQPSWVIEEDLERDFYMSPTEARIYGIIDLIGAE